jgi:hypothetical protein
MTHSSTNNSTLALFPPRPSAPLDRTDLAGLLVPIEHESVKAEDKIPPMKKLHQITEEADKRIADKPKQEQLPLWADWERAMPTAISRSALFAPIAKGRRKRHVGSAIDSRRDVSLTYTGEQFDMSDADVFMQALEIAKRFPLNTRIVINRAQFLSCLDRTYQSKSKKEEGKVRKSSIGKSGYEWLDASMTRLAEGSLTYKFMSPGKLKDKGGVLHLISGWKWDNEADSYSFLIETEIHKLFESFSRIYLAKHLTLPKTDQLAKWMHLFVAGCEKGALTKIGIDHLRAYSGNKHRRMDHFVASMERAMQALDSSEIIAPGWFIRENDRMLNFTRIA